jgi:peptide/nickel transport system substrate-binding protein
VFRRLEMDKLTASIVLASVLALGLPGGEVAAQGQPDGQLTIAFDASIAPTFLDPAETPGIGTPFVFLYALHDALIKPLPGNDMAPCVAESWRESPDGLVYEFKLREGLRFHKGDPVTAEDVKFSFQRYRGASAKLLHDRVKAVEMVDPYRVRFVLHTPWPDFLVFYATPATGAAWIVPKKYIEKVGEDGFRRQPVGLGPYRLVRMNPGIELVLEANEPYWRKKPTIKRVVIKGVPDRTTRLAMLKTWKADIGYLMVGVEAATIKADRKLRLAKVIAPAAWWLEFPEQWNPKSPWNDRRVRLAANLAMDKPALNEAERSGTHA